MLKSIPLKKPLLSLLALAASMPGIGARTLTPDEARGAAASFLGSHAGALKRTASRTPGALSLLGTVKCADASPALYLFTTPQGGLMVASAESGTPAVLGYTDYAPAPGEPLNPSLQEWLDTYAAEIHAYRLRGADGTGSQGMPRRIQHNLAPIAPLMAMKWNQSAPYNLLTPVIDGAHCPTGCVATAMAMVMRYHQWPEVHGIGTASYTWKYDSSTLSQDLEQSVYDWANMPAVYDSSATSAQQNAVAVLMRDAGYAVHMNYKLGGSGATISNIAPALMKNFGYDAATLNIFRFSYTLSQWEQKIYSELAAARPVIFTGENSKIGHCFVCDGYSSESYFHINWGWGGLSDGYFLLSALDPSTQGIGGSDAGYNAAQSAVIGIRPPVAGSDSITAMGLGKDFVQSASTTSTIYTSSSDTIYFKSKYVNIGNTKLKGSLGLKITNDATGAETLKWIWAINPGPGSSYASIPILSKNLPTTAGTYTITPVWKLTGGTATDLQHSPSVISSVKMEVASSKRTFTNSRLAYKLKVDSAALLTPLHQTYPFIMTGKLINTGTEIYPDSIYACLLATGTNTMMYFSNKTRMEIEPNDTVPITFSGTFPAKVVDGQYDLVFMDRYHWILSKRIPVEITAMTDEPVAEMTDLAMVSGWTSPTGLQYVTDDNIRFTGTLACTSGYFCDRLTAYVFPETGGTSLCSIAKTDMQLIAAGDTVPVDIRTTFPLGVKGNNYLLGLFDSNHHQVSNLALFRVNGLTDIEALDAEGAPRLLMHPDGTLEVLGAAPGTQVSIYAASGALLMASATSTRINVSHLPTGIYVARLQSPSGSAALRFAR